MNIHRYLIHNGPKMKQLKWMNRFFFFKVVYSFKGMFLAMKNDEVMIHATMWVNFRNIMPNKSCKRLHFV